MRHHQLLSPRWKSLAEDGKVQSHSYIAIGPPRKAVDCHPRLQEVHFRPRRSAPGAGPGFHRRLHFTNSLACREISHLRLPARFVRTLPEFHRVGIIENVAISRIAIQFVTGPPGNVAQVQQQHAAMAFRDGAIRRGAAANAVDKILHVRLIHADAGADDISRIDRRPRVLPLFSHDILLVVNGAIAAIQDSHCRRFQTPSPRAPCCR